ncbi:sigma-54 dependent transcriptional regulator [Pelagibius sp.]|uniref:sigma-54-dependent transcriptional regulator n=1 Tax=Pelagibius sp. TaxID=1931238 RepID=UPI00260F860E|nr:sigma-54 dependent transcriptional regulator [Pelagibius sp.]
MLPEGCKIGLVEDDPVMGESLLQRLTLEGCAVDWWTTGREAMSGLRRFDPDLVVCDIRLPDMAGGALFEEAVRGVNAPPFLFITAYGEIDQAVGLMRAGAGDYLTKPFAMDDFLDRVKALLSRKDPLGVEDHSLGGSKAMRAVEHLLRRVAGLESALLITGETGSGKEVCARFVHQISPAGTEPFVAVNCAAIPDSLLESELFGHEKGAFTGAHARHLGYAERAKGGVLFLDEVADMPLPLQAKLLRLLEDRAFHRIGGERPVPFDARLICATNRNLNEAVRQGSFREDLHFRINVIPVEVPPLRERRQDVAPLLHRFAAEFAALMVRDVSGVSALAEEAALAHDWPGNVRELRNRVERAVALARGAWLMPGDLFPEVGRPEDGQAGDIATLSEVRDAAERRQILRALQATDGQVAKAADALGVSRTTLWEKMRRLQVNAKEAASS